MEKKYYLYAGFKSLFIPKYFLLIVRDEENKIYFLNSDSKGKIISLTRINKKQYESMKSYIISIPSSWKRKSIKIGDKMIFGKSLVFCSKKMNEILVVPFRIISSKKLSKELR